MTCTECQELKRKYVTLVTEVRSLSDRTKSRHASPPERRRLHRLKTDTHIAKQLLENHTALCKEVSL